MTIMQMLWLLAQQLSISFSMLVALGLPLISYFLKERSTLRLAEVELNVSIMNCNWAPLKWMMPTSTGCLEAKMGLLNRLKKAYFPRSTELFLPSYNLGVQMTLAFILSMLRLIFIPMPSNSSIYFAFFSLFISYPISLHFSQGGLMVASEIFFRLNSSKSSGIPVMSSNSGTRSIIYPFLLLSTATRGCLVLAMVMLYFFLQYSGILSVPSGVSKEIEDISSKRMSAILWQTVFPQLLMTVCPTRHSFRIIRFSSLSLSPWILQVWSMKSSTVWFLTIFLAASTLRNIPFSSQTKLDLNPLYITNPSISLFSLELKYFPVFPISTYPRFLIEFLIALFIKARSSLGFLLSSYILTSFTEILQPSSLTKNSFYLPSLKEKMFLPENTGFLICSEIFFFAFSNSCILRRELSSGMKGVNLMLKMTIFSIFCTSNRQWLDKIFTLLKFFEWSPRIRVGRVWRTGLLASSIGLLLIGNGSVHGRHVQATK